VQWVFLTGFLSIGGVIGTGMQEVRSKGTGAKWLQRSFPGYWNGTSQWRTRRLVLIRVYAVVDSRFAGLLLGYAVVGTICYSVMVS